jgi:hypothetical protein
LKQDGPRDSFQEKDQIWAVFDRDTHPKVAETIKRADAAGILVAYSNPCFELWLVLHYRNHDAPESHRNMQKILRGLMPGYNPNGSKKVAFDQICNSVELAESRAEALEKRRRTERNSAGNPSTTVYKLTREIRKHGKK